MEHHGILFGPPAALRALDAAARRQLVRGPADEAYLDMAVGITPRTFAHIENDSPEELKAFLEAEDVFVYRVMRFGAKLFRNPRMVACVVTRTGR